MECIINYSTVLTIIETKNNIFSCYLIVINRADPLDLRPCLLRARWVTKANLHNKVIDIIRN